MGREGGGDELGVGIGIDTLPHVKKTVSGKLLCSTGRHSAQCCDDLEGYKQEVGGRLRTEQIRVNI